MVLLAVPEGGEKNPAAGCPLGGVTKILTNEPRDFKRISLRMIKNICFFKVSYLKNLYGIERLFGLI